MVASWARSVLGLAAAVGASGRLGAVAARAGVPVLTIALGCGAVAGPQGFGWLLQTPFLGEVQRICLAILIFAAGAELHPSQLRAHLRLISVLTVCISAGSWIVSLCVGLAVLPRALPPGAPSLLLPAALSAAVAIGRSPASAISVLRETRSAGLFSTVSLGVVIAKDVVLFLVFAVTEGIAKAALGGAPAAVDGTAATGGDGTLGGTGLAASALGGAGMGASALGAAAAAGNATSGGLATGARAALAAAADALPANATVALGDLGAASLSGNASSRALLGALGLESSPLPSTSSPALQRSLLTSTSSPALQRSLPFLSSSPFSVLPTRSLLLAAPRPPLGAHSPLRPALLALGSALAAAAAGAAAGAALPLALHALGLAAPPGAARRAPSARAATRFSAAASRVGTEVRARAATWRSAAGLGGRRWSPEPAPGTPGGGAGGPAGGAGSGLPGAGAGLVALARLLVQGTACVLLALVGPMPASDARDAGAGAGLLPPPPPLLAGLLPPPPPAVGQGPPGGGGGGGGGGGAHLPGRGPASHLLYGLRAARAALSRLAGRLAPAGPRAHDPLRHLLALLSPPRLASELVALLAAFVWAAFAIAVRLTLLVRGSLPPRPPLAALAPAAVARGAYGLGASLGVEPLLCTVSAGAAYAAATGWARARASAAAATAGPGVAPGAAAPASASGAPVPAAVGHRHHRHHRHHPAPRRPPSAEPVEVPARLMGWANVLFFSLSGASIDFRAVLGAREAALALFAARVAGVFLGARAGVCALSVAAPRPHGWSAGARSIHVLSERGKDAGGDEIELRGRAVAAGGVGARSQAVAAGGGGARSQAVAAGGGGARSQAVAAGGGGPQGGVDSPGGPSPPLSPAGSFGRVSRRAPPSALVRPPSSPSPSPPGLAEGAAAEVLVGGGQGHVSRAAAHRLGGWKHPPPPARETAPSPPLDRSLSPCSSAPPSPFASVSPGSPVWLGAGLGWGDPAEKGGGGAEVAHEAASGLAVPRAHALHDSDPRSRSPLHPHPQAPLQSPLHPHPQAPLQSPLHPHPQAPLQSPLHPHPQAPLQSPLHPHPQAPLQSPLHPHPQAPLQSHGDAVVASSPSPTPTPTPPPVPFPQLQSPAPEGGGAGSGGSASWTPEGTPEAPPEVLLTDTPGKLVEADAAARTPSALMSASSVGRRGSGPADLANASPSRHRSFSHRPAPLAHAGSLGRAGPLAHAGSLGRAGPLAHAGSLGRAGSAVARAAAEAAVAAGLVSHCSARTPGADASFSNAHSGGADGSRWGDAGGDADRRAFGAGVAGAAGAAGATAPRPLSPVAEASPEERRGGSRAARVLDFPAAVAGPLGEGSAFSPGAAPPAGGFFSAGATAPVGGLGSPGPSPLGSAPPPLGVPGSFAHLWLAMLTQAGVTLGLVDEVRRAFPVWGEAWASVQTAVVLLNLAVGPLAYRAALHAAGEAGGGAGQTEGGGPAGGGAGEDEEGGGGQRAKACRDDQGGEAMV